MMRKPTYSVFGRIDFFSVLKSLLVSLGSAADGDWAITRTISGWYLSFHRVAVLTSTQNSLANRGSF